MDKTCGVRHTKHGTCGRKIGHKGGHVASKDGKLFMWLADGQPVNDGGKKKV